MSTLKVGLVGAGPWARAFHAAMISTGPETELAAIWARRPEAARQLAAAFDTTYVERFEDLLERCEAVVFSVPPDVQAALAPVAARAGKALLLEKPIGLELAQAEALTDALLSEGVVTQLMLTNRYSARVRDFVADVRRHTPVGAIATYISDACATGGYFATPWRIAKGALLDLGPHVLDLLDTTLGPIVDIHGRGDPTRWFTATIEHESGAISQTALSLTTPCDGSTPAVRVFTEHGEFAMDYVTEESDPNVSATIRSEFAAAVRSGASHELDVARGLYLQRWLDRAERSAAR